jgi:hypothetical protein
VSSVIVACDSISSAAWQIKFSSGLKANPPAGNWTVSKPGGRYRLRVDDADDDSDAWCTRLLRWLGRYPIVSIEDPLAERYEAGMIAFTRAAGRVQIIGDDFLTTSAARVRHAAHIGACNAVLRQRYHEGQESPRSARTGVNIIVLWNTLYINAALQQLEQEGFEISPRTSPAFHRWFLNILTS